MSSEPSFPKDAAVGTPKQNETLDVAVTAKEASEKAGGGHRVASRSFVRGAAVGVGSAAVVAALLYANRSRRTERGAETTVRREHGPTGNDGTD